MSEGAGRRTAAWDKLAASPRILIPILENWQNGDGSVTVPDALRPYIHGRERIR